MRELLYVPPGTARLTGAIGVLVPELANPIFPALAAGDGDPRGDEAGSPRSSATRAARHCREAEYVHMLLERRVDGMIFISSEMTDLRGDHSHYAQLVGEGARIVFVNGAMHALDVPSVGVDERAAGEIATQHLIDLGHERIGFVAGPDHSLPTREKARRPRARAAAAGLEPDGLVAHAEFGVDGGRRRCASCSREPVPPTGVICSSDLMAIGALHEAAAHGLPRPRRLLDRRLRRHRATKWSDPS